MLNIMNLLVRKALNVANPVKKIAFVTKDGTKYNNAGKKIFVASVIHHDLWSIDEYVPVSRSMKHSNSILGEFELQEEIDSVRDENGFVVYVTADGTLHPAHIANDGMIIDDNGCYNLLMDAATR